MKTRRTRSTVRKEDDVESTSSSSPASLVPDNHINHKNSIEPDKSNVLRKKRQLKPVKDSLLHKKTKKLLESLRPKYESKPKRRSEIKNLGGFVKNLNNISSNLNYLSYDESLKEQLENLEKFKIFKRFNVSMETVNIILKEKTIVDNDDKSTVTNNIDENNDTNDDHDNDNDNEKDNENDNDKEFNKYNDELKGILQTNDEDLQTEKFNKLLGITPVREFKEFN
ncbi:hypothetical protein WICMUC_004774 [Wickerhamomyces mucosus]|uniref:Uncharacterized protein n=1 Tax=Wickerhamomyces mucosus TaxID=1378264 RepID=A0A9P8T9B7_9ASCO|nr:hypothetical protein WICMUC_004774 [Wickerhamomyces mucosus]